MADQPSTKNLHWYVARGQDQGEAFLDRAEQFLKDEAEHLELDYEVMRKELVADPAQFDGTKISRRFQSAQ